MARTVAYHVIRRLEEDDAFANRALDAELAKADLDDRDRRLATELAYGVPTWRRALDEVIEEYVHGGISGLDREVLWVLRLGVYQLLFLDRIPDHAVVDEAVEMTREEANPGATSLVNAVLRSITRADEVTWWDEADRERKIVRYLGKRYSIPNWIANRLVQLYGEERAEQLAQSFNERPPIYLRVLGDDRPEDADDLDEELEAVEGIPKAYRSQGMSRAVASALSERRWIIQDIGSQLIGRFVGAEPGQRVLDACAGLGGKTFCLVDDVGSEGLVVAVDSIEWKVDKLEEAAEQMDFGPYIETHGLELDAFAKQAAPFERVLVDAPCSALGILRRHPEIRWNRHVSDIPSVVELQRSLLDTAAELVTVGGVLTYSVCTFTTEEGPKQVDAFLERHDDFELVGPPETEGVDWERFTDEEGHLVVDPVQHDSDMFFAARLKRTEKTED
jgi:16S rRNA (cytosine967-C5)-methyltransferase